MCAALSDQACTAIRRWTQPGGQLMADLLPSTFTAHGRLRGTGTSASGSTENPSNPLAASSGSPQALPPISTGATPWPTVQGAGIPFQSRCVDTATTGVTTTPVEPWAARTFEFTGSYGQSRALCVPRMFAVRRLRGGSTRAGDVERTATPSKLWAALLQGLRVKPHAEVVHANGPHIELARSLAQNGCCRHC